MITFVPMLKQYKRYKHMRKKRWTAMCLAIWGMIGPLAAQTPEERGLEVINRATAEAHIGFLADDDLLGREAGTREGRIAGDYIVANLKSLGIAPLDGSYYHPFEAYHLERQKRGARWQVEPDSIVKIKQTNAYQKMSLNNILGVIEGKNPNEIVIVGAHYDHLGLDPFLEGDQIYNGADDNASGVSAVLQIARAFVATGEQPERTVIFAFWDGEEKGLLGSRHFTRSYPEIGKVKGYLNFDMIGRNNDESKPKHVVYFYTESHPAFGEWLKGDIKKYSLGLEPDYRPWDKPVGGSDNGSFARLEIPIIWYHTDAHPDYHQPSDHAERINWEKVVAITKVSFLNMWYMANKKEF